MGFFRSPYLYVPLALLALAVIVLRMATSATDALYLGPIVAVLAGGLGYEALRRRRQAKICEREDRVPNGR